MPTNRRVALAVGWSLVVFLSLTACANKKAATQIDQTIVTVAASFQDAEIAAHKAGKISDDTHGKIMYQMGTVWRLAGQYNGLVRDWPGTGAPPKDLVRIGRELVVSIQVVIDLLPGTDSDTMRWAKQMLQLVESVLKAAGQEDTDATH